MPLKRMASREFTEELWCPLLVWVCFGRRSSGCMIPSKFTPKTRKAVGCWVISVPFAPYCSPTQPTLCGEEWCSQPQNLTISCQISRHMPYKSTKRRASEDISEVAVSSSSKASLLGQFTSPLTKSSMISSQSTSDWCYGLFQLLIFMSYVLDILTLT